MPGLEPVFAALTQLCGRHSQARCTWCTGRGCDACDGTGKLEITLAECLCPTMAEALGLPERDVIEAFNR